MQSAFPSGLVTATSLLATDQLFLRRPTTNENLQVNANTLFTFFGAAATPNASAVLDLTSTTKGFLPPRMTTTQRDAISTPAEGLVIYNLSTHKLNVFTTTWEEVTSA